MLVSATSMVDSIRPRLPAGERPVSVDWLPWSHTFGGNVVLHSALRRGTAVHLDAGAPMPGRFDQTVANLRDVCPTELNSVPAACSLLLQAMESNADFATRFFSRLRSCSFGGAALSPMLYERFQALAVRTCGQRIAFTGGYGMTETCGIITSVYWATDRADLVGLPPPGVTLKLVRLDATRFECRVRGPNVFHGYAGTSNGSSFDEEGYFLTGDAVEFACASDPAAGLVFAGRLKEDFKLANGSWVRAARLREELLNHLRPTASDLIVIGENREELAALVWATEESSVFPALQKRCREFNANRSTTQRIARLMVLRGLPSSQDGELTAKGTINTRRVVERRQDQIEQLYTRDRYRV